MKNLLSRRMIASISMFMAVLLCIETVLSINVYAFQKDSSELEEKKFNLISNVISEDNITLYQYQDEYYISVEDLCDLTRCTYSVEDGVITLIQGFWGAEFDYDEQTFRDGEQIINTHIFKLSGKDNYAIPVLEYLLYFKSSIAYIKDDTLYCTMPEFTAWEALDIDYENTLIDIYELYGGEGYVTFSLTLDILMDFILGDMPANSDMYVKDAYDAALTVNLSKYEAVGQYIEENSSALNSFIDSDKAKDTFELLDGLVEHGSSGMEYFISSYYNLVANDFAETMIYAFDEGKIDTGFYCANKVLEAFEKEDLIKENTEKFADKTSEFLFWTSLAVESAMEIKQHADTDYLLYNVMGSKNVSSLGLNVQDNSYFSIANQYKNESEIAKNNVIEKYAEFLADQMKDEVEKLIEPVVKEVTGLGTASWGFSKDAAVFFVKNFPPTHATIEAFKADIRGLFLSEVQQNVYFVIYKIHQKLSKNWNNEDLYKKYIDAELLYCRVSIAMYEDLITRVDEFSGKHDRKYWKSVFRNRIDYLAIKMYQLTVFQDDGMSKCCPMDLSAYNVPLVIVIPKDVTYILPESDTRIYDISEIQALTEEELELASNEIFARRGRKFKREDLQEYFEGKSWYEGSIEPNDFDDNTMLSDVEKANLELIRGVEEGTFVSVALENFAKQFDYLQGKMFAGYIVEDNRYSSGRYDMTSVPIQYVDYYIYDFDGDNQEELLLLNLKGEHYFLALEMYEYINGTVENVSIIELEQYGITINSGVAERSCLDAWFDCFLFKREVPVIGIDVSCESNILVDGKNVRFLAISYNSSDFTVEAYGSFDGSAGLDENYMNQLALLDITLGWDDLFYRQVHLRDCVGEYNSILRISTRYLIEFSDYWNWKENRSYPLPCTEIVFGK